MDYIARIRQCDGSVQGIEEHCRNCARYAADNLPGLRNAAYLAGLLHDMGKYAAGFQDYIIRTARGERIIRGSVNPHSPPFVSFWSGGTHLMCPIPEIWQARLLPYRPGRITGCLTALTPTAGIDFSTD